MWWNFSILRVPHILRMGGNWLKNGYTYRAGYSKFKNGNNLTKIGGFAGLLDSSGQKQGRNWIVPIN